MKKFLIVFWSSNWGGGGGGGTAGFVFFGFCFVPVVGSVGLVFLVFGFVPVGFPVGVGGGWGCGGFLFNIRAAGFRESFLGAHWGLESCFPVGYTVVVCGHTGVMCIVLEGEP